MRWVCAREHRDYMSYGLRTTGPEDFDGFLAWLSHQVMAHWFWLRGRLVAIGFIDTPGEMEPLHWRWDFWNSRWLAWCREQERKDWEKKRGSARARWGEGGG